MRQILFLSLMLISFTACNGGGGGSSDSKKETAEPVEVFELNARLWESNGRWGLHDASDGTDVIYKFFNDGTYIYIKRIPNSTIVDQSEGTVKALADDVLEFTDIDSGVVVTLDYSFEGPVLKLCYDLQCEGFDWYQ